MKRNMHILKLICLVLALFLIGAMLVSCGDAEVTVAGSSSKPNANPAGLDASAAGQQGKIVITMTVRAYTDNFDEDFKTLKDSLFAVGGYIASSTSNYSQSSGNTVTATLKVPADKCQEFTDSFTAYLEIRSSEVKSEDITEQYIDVESRITALETERDTLQKMMENSDNYSNIMTVSQRLTTVIGELEKAKALLAEYEKRVAYSTIHLTLTEVLEEETVEEPGVFKRIGTTFMESLGSVGEFFSGLLVFFVGGFPILLVIGLIPAAIIIIVKISKKRAAKKKKENPTPPPPAAYRAPYQPPMRPPMPPQTPPTDNKPE